jgi:hypothetical protein
MLTVTESPSIVLLPNRAVSPELPSKKDIRLEAGEYVARLALTEGEKAAAFRLRFLVFNLEMNEGSSRPTWMALIRTTSTMCATT